MRSVLHDVANSLAGIQGILELHSPHTPLSDRDRERLNAILSEGFLTLDRTRHLALGTLPSAVVLSGGEWRSQLMQRLSPLEILFRKRFDVRYEGELLYDRWPGELLQDYVHALTKRLLAYIQEDSVTIACEADGRCWRLSWPQVQESGDCNVLTVGDLKDLTARWTEALGNALGVYLNNSQKGFLVQIPRF